MRISDWSSDVCSSDLLEPDVPAERLCRPAVDRPRMAAQDGAQDQPDVGGAAGSPSGSHDRRPFDEMDRDWHVVMRRIYRFLDLDIVPAEAGMAAYMTRSERDRRSTEEHTSELQALMRNTY